MEFAYVPSIIDDVCKGQISDKEAITERMNELARKRRSKQPLNSPSAEQYIQET